MIVSVRNALRHYQTEAELRSLRARARREIIGESRPMQELLRQVIKVGGTRARVLIEGESGTGKELVARAIHDASERRAAAFVKVNCAAIPRELIESELFGHERGAFTGATGQKRGLFELAHGGTLFLDEIGDMDLNAQAKVLRVLQSGELMRVGGERPIKVDVRVLAATHRNLRELVGTGEFREDLYFRLAVVPISVPPLRERPGDVGLLCRYYLDLACHENGIAPKRMSPAAQATLETYSWPGNVRELRNVMERIAILSDGDIEIGDVPQEIRGDPEEEAGAPVGGDAVVQFGEGLSLRACPSRPSATRSSARSSSSG
ncbi:sigma-54 interaction domain-containing protein [Nannocystis pusilla]|uniref:sigma-54 interaction domain-containing protein n=1 Tax=Nannocystis pusilla TaxID=889268 RepID=UPI003B7C5E7F